MSEPGAGRSPSDSPTPPASGSAPVLAGAPTRQPPAIPDHELLQPIGRGAYGEVWLARNLTTGLRRAVKIVRRSEFEDDRPCQREFEGLLRYEPVSRSHPGLVQILHVGRNEAEGYFYYVMELADDAASGAAAASEASDTSGQASYQPKTLASELLRCGRLPFEECLTLFLSTWAFRKERLSNTARPRHFDLHKRYTNGFLTQNVS